jgi:hypothetical protein
MKKLVTVAVGIAILLAGCYAASPVLGFWRLQQAARTGNQDALEEVVDFPAVRGAMKAELHLGLMEKLQSSPGLKGNGFATLGLMFANALIDKVVDSYLTPQAIAMMVTRAKPPRPDGRADASPPPQLDRTYGYVTLDRFRVTVADHAHPDLPLAFVMERRGLFDWKLIRIDLPPKLFG